MRILAGVIELLSKNLDVTLTPDGLRELTRRLEHDDQKEEPQEPGKLQVHRLSQRLGPERVAQVKDRYESGESARSIASDLGVATSALIRLLREHNVIVRTHSVTTQQAAVMAMEYKEGVTMAELQEKYKLSHGAVFRALHRAGIEARPSGRRVGRPPRLR